MLLFDSETHPAVIAVIVAIMGVGIGFTFQPTLVAFQAHCTKKQRAVVISDRNFFRCLGGACNLAISAALLQATLKSNLPPGYEHLSDSTYSLPSKSSVPAVEWTQILHAYAKASRSVFILQVPLIGVCFIACLFVRDRGLEMRKDRGEDDDEKAGRPAETPPAVENDSGADPSLERGEKQERASGMGPELLKSSDAPQEKILDR